MNVEGENFGFLGDTISDIADRDIRAILESAVLGDMSFKGARIARRRLDKMKEAAGGGCFDSYGPPPPELSDFNNKGDEHGQAY
jgi:hypothetical protein